MPSLRLLLALGGVAAAQRLGSFLVIGDWGWDPEAHGNTKDQGCQRAIGDLMNQTMQELGDVKFVVNVGDSFYPNGLSSKQDPQWDYKWRGVYSEELRSVPWYSVYGNHDLHHDPCVCATNVAECAQQNSDPQNLDYFFMPDVSYSIELPDLQTEVIGLDANYLWADNTCRWTACPDQCRSVLKARLDSALQLFNERMAQTNASNLVVFSHYPTDYFWGYPDFLAQLSNNATSRRHAFFGGHRHNVDQSSTTSISPHASWLSGGGGGWGCDGDKQGFVVGEIWADGNLTTREVVVDPEVCCQQAWWWPMHAKTVQLPPI